MITGPKASRIPVVERGGMDRICLRCGIEWIDHRSKFVQRAPCADCRLILADEGVDVIAEYVRPHRQAAAYAARERRAASYERRRSVAA